MRVEPTNLPGVLVLELPVYSDERGFFMETFQGARYRQCGISVDFVQDNQSRSRRGILRGLHYQLKQPQAKLVRVARGEVYDVCVDIRRGSPTFGGWFGRRLSDEEATQVFIPAGFAHGFCVLSDVADFEYKCSAYYAPDDQYAIRWNDPSIGITWPLVEVHLSEKDRTAPLLAEIQEAHLPRYEGTP